jgi:hypothetical protein
MLQVLHVPEPSSGAKAVLLDTAPCAKSGASRPTTLPRALSSSSKQDLFMLLPLNVSTQNWHERWIFSQQKFLVLSSVVSDQRSGVSSGTTRIFHSLMSEQQQSHCTFRAHQQLAERQQLKTAPTYSSRL